MRAQTREERENLRECALEHARATSSRIQYETPGRSAERLEEAALEYADAVRAHRAPSRWSRSDLDNLDVALEVYGGRKVTPAGLVWIAHVMAAASEAAAERRGLDPGSVRWGDKRVACLLRWLADVAEEAAESREQVAAALKQGKRDAEELRVRRLPPPDDGREYR